MAAVCAYPPCGRQLPEDAPRNQRYHASQCRTADWKLRKSQEPARAPGDAENVRNTALTPGARAKREARARGPIGADKRVSYAKAVACVTEMLEASRVVPYPQARWWAESALGRALPERFREAS